MNELPIYWTDDLKGLTVFDVIVDTVDKCPEVLDELKEFLNELRRSN